ncbi:hypothetical protein KFU94_29230 [Chloroflexi bacterium TSY]|nr:hypothetical protein [Chloroflexi bacterium TSY]
MTTTAKIVSHTEIMRQQTNRPPVLVLVDDPQVQSGGDVWRGPVSTGGQSGEVTLAALTSSNGWLEITWSEPATAVGVQFWGDQNDGWACILINNVQVWEGNTVGEGVNFETYLEVRNLPNERHTVRVEAVGRPGRDGGDVHVAIVTFGWGEVPGESDEGSTIFLPFFTRT